MFSFLSRILFCQLRVIQQKKLLRMRLKDVNRQN